MFGVYKFNREDWMKAKLDSIFKNIKEKQEKDDISIDYFADPALYVYVKEIYDRLRDDINFALINEFRIADIQRLTGYTFPVVARIFDLFDAIGLFVIEKYKKTINHCVNNYLSEPVEHYLVIRTFGEDDNKEIVSVLIESKWHHHLYDIRDYRVVPTKHTIEAVNDVLRMPTDKLVKFEEIAFEVKIALSRGIVICDKEEKAVLLSKYLEGNNEASDFMNRIFFISCLSEITSHYERKIKRLNLNTDYLSMTSDAFYMEGINYEYQKVYTINDLRTKYRFLIDLQKLYLKECENANKSVYDNIFNENNKQDILLYLSKSFNVNIIHLLNDKLVEFYNWIVDNQDILGLKNRLKLNYLEDLNREDIESIKGIIRMYDLGKYGELMI